MRQLCLCFAAALMLAGCAAAPPMAPQPVKPIDAARFFTGRWYEIARTPMSLTKNCVAGTTDYYHRADGQLMDRDACRMGTPEGKVKSYTGSVTILDAEQNKVRVDYTVWGIFSVDRTYWMLDHGTDYRWFIVSDPAFKHVSLFTRDPHPPAEMVRMLTARAASLGYDTQKLEYPAEFPSSR